jgi:hypothetical protein
MSLPLFPEFSVTGTEFSLSKPPAPAPAPIDLSAYKPTTKPSYAGIGGGDLGSGPMTPSSLDSGSTGRTKKFERQKSNPTVPPLMPVRHICVYRLAAGIAMRLCPMLYQEGRLPLVI